MSTICKCKSCDCLFPEKDIKFKPIIFSNVPKNEEMIIVSIYVGNGHRIIIPSEIDYLLETDMTLHCPKCEAIIINDLEIV